LIAALALGIPFGDQARADDTQVDLALVLAVDVSSSMTLAELQVQRDGYVAAISDPRVADALRSGYFHRIALSYVEWADPGLQVLTMPWHLIDSQAAARAFAVELAAKPLAGGTDTSISAGLQFAAAQFHIGGIGADRQVIDISGDGPNTAGPPVAPTRDRIVSGGIVINGLPILVGVSVQDQAAGETLAGYYRDCVTGGAGSFVLPVKRRDEIVTAIRRKLVIEIAGADPQIVPVVAIKTPKADCTLGQKDFFE